MYKIFINEKPFIITTSDLSELRFAKCKRVTYNPSKIIEYIKDCESMKSKGFVMIHPDTREAFTDFLTHFVLIEAAGGIVFNTSDELLLIKRLGKWDLPKGKIDSGEKSEEAAVREVMEECGIENLTLDRKIVESYHTYKMHNHRFLKVTHWYKMNTSFDKKLIPQQEENITEAKWFNWNQLDLETLDTYNSIRDVLLSLKP